MNFAFPKLHSHELVLFFYPSPGLNWESPRALTFSTMRNELLRRPRTLGHASVLVRTPTDFILTGMTQLDGGEGRRKVLNEGYGMGILLHNFRGQLEKAEKLIPELEARARTPGKLSYLRVPMNPEIAKRLLEYLAEYRHRGCDGFYGMRNRPLFAEGGGCSAFAASFLEAAGLMRDEFAREWTRTFNIPHATVGGPITGKKVSVIEMFRRAKRWAKSEEAHEKGFFWDPDLMHRWVLRMHAGEVDHSREGLGHEKWEAAHGITLDAKNSASPTGPIFRL